jgi:ABC-type multidrug transport system ATPase subunit
MILKIIIIIIYSKMDDLLHVFNKILIEKRNEIIEIANNKKKENKKMTDTATVDKLTCDISKTIYRINAATEKKFKDSARYKKKEEELLLKNDK